MTKATTRVYVVKQAGQDTPRLVRATFRSVAVRHVAQDHFSARMATHDDLEKWITAGVRVEQASDTLHEQSTEA